MFVCTFVVKSALIYSCYTEGNFFPSFSLLYSAIGRMCCLQILWPLGLEMSRLWVNKKKNHQKKKPLHFPQQAHTHGQWFRQKKKKKPYHVRVVLLLARCQTYDCIQNGKLQLYSYSLTTPFIFNSFFYKYFCKELTSYKPDEQII